MREKMGLGGEEGKRSGKQNEAKRGNLRKMINGKLGKTRLGRGGGNRKENIV